MGKDNRYRNTMNLLKMILKDLDYFEENELKEMEKTYTFETPINQLKLSRVMYGIDYIYGLDYYILDYNEKNFKFKLKRKNVWLNELPICKLKES